MLLPKVYLTGRAYISSRAQCREKRPTPENRQPSLRGAWVIWAIQCSKFKTFSLLPSLPSRGGLKRGCFGHLNLEFRICLGFRY